MPLGIERLCGSRLVLLPFVDEKRQPQLIASEQIEVPGEAIALIGDFFAQAYQIGKIAGQRIGLRAHFRHHGAERDCGAHRRKRVLGPHKKRGRRLPSDALQGGENFNDDVAALGKRLSKNLFPLVERHQARLCGVNIGLNAADARCGIDEILIELATILAQRFDLDAQFGLVFHRAALAGECRVEFLIVLRKRVCLARRLCRGRGQRRRRCRILSGIRSRRGEFRWRLGERYAIGAKIGAERGCKSQSRAEHGGTE